LTRYLGAKSDNIRKNEPYEGGVRATIGDSSHTFNVKFFLVGIIFLIFDVEVLFMLPWALNLRDVSSDFLGLSRWPFLWVFWWADLFMYIEQGF